MCPLCVGRMELVYHRPDKNVYVCADCHTSISVAAVTRRGEAKVRDVASAL